MRKYLLAILSAVCIACVAFAFGCINNSVEPNYFKVQFNEKQEGITFVFDDVAYEVGGEPEPFKSGAWVKEGINLRFALEVDEELFNPDDLTVTANSQILTKGENGKYSFTVNEDTIIYVLNDVIEKKVSLLRGSRTTPDEVPGDLIKYFDREGNEYEDSFYTTAEELSFRIKLSSYYRLQDGFDDILVTSNTRIVTPGEDGYYTIKLDGNTVVEVQGYTEDISFTERSDGGSGTKNDPFILRRPIDLYQMAAIINDDWYLGYYNTAYFELGADIDLEGDQLFIIGDSVMENAYFCGSFDGKGHTISNFYIQDIIIDQEEFLPIQLLQVGMFGWVRSYVKNDGLHVPVIKNLNLKDYTIDVHKSGKLEIDGWIGDIPFMVGSIAGYVDGGSIINCSASGNVNVSTSGADCNWVGYAGGIVGSVSSHYEENVMNVETSVVGCTSDVKLQGVSGNIIVAGGIVGLLNTMAERTPAYVADCVNSGNISGAFRAGGIVGQISAYSSVVNCLSTADYIDARCDLQSAGSTEVLNAYAGGIAGYADYESLIYGCYSASDISAYSAKGNNYTGYIVGKGIEANSGYVESHDALVVNSYSKLGSAATKFTESLLNNTLKWNTGNWTLKQGDEYPVVSISAEGSTVTVPQFSVKVNTSDNDTITTYSAEEYVSLATLYRNGGMEEYLGDSASRTYGYFFDEELTRRVPCSFVLTSETTLYTGFADYGEISGKYYLRREGNEGSGTYFELKADGTLLFRSGAVSYESTYYYDGENILLYQNPAFLVTVTTEEGTSSTMYCGIGKIIDGVLIVYDNHNYTKEAPLNAIPEIEGFVYGTYYTANVDYTFNGDGTVNKSGAILEYSVSGNTLTIINGTESETVIIENGVPVSVNGAPLSALDRFAGVWETGMLGTTRYTFDGKGSYSYETFDYTNGRRTNVNVSDGDYEFTEGKVLLDNGTELTVNENGYVEIDGVEYYRQYSLTGSWRFFARRAIDVIELKVMGVNVDGYGVAEVKFGTSRDVYTLNYEVGIIEATSTSDEVAYLRFYYLNGLEGTLQFNAVDFTLTGSFSGVAGCIFCLYDDLKGEWLSTEFGLISFNGLGLYNRLEGSNITTVVGSVLSGTKEVGSYLLSNGTASGTMTYNGKEYTIVYNKADDKITVSDGNNTFTLGHDIDSFADAKIVDSDGKVYTFDGFGNLASGGNVFVDGVATYKYFNNDGGTVKIVLGSEEGSLTVSGNAYVLEVGAIRKELTLYNVFTGEWQISGMRDGRIVIGTLGIDKKAQGSYLGTNVEFVYLDGVLSFEYNGDTLYVISYSTFGRYKFAISENRTTANGVLHYCVAVGDLDAFAGVYVHKDGGSMLLDGFANSTSDGQNWPGSAIMYDAEGRQTVYSYKIINRAYKGVEITLTDGSKLLLVESAEGEYTKGDKSYNLVEPDEFYPGTYYTSYVMEVVGTEGEVVAYYTFDGMGKMMDLLSEEYYTYEKTGADESKCEIYLSLTKESDGSKYTAVLDYSYSTEVLLTIQEA